ncbi:MAG: response regulator transcription factor [Deltaproteobacteria bacterium]|nr:response regulator transcription factor [Deltaproteobacteria bacterium]MBW2393069.1 response regulator transcription factor [Deltaproteobacteria bacterium]
MADVLGVRPGTVKTHVETLLGILQVANRTEAVFALIERGVVVSPEPD